ncbi:MAG: hypothetical protein DDT19_02669 [Syntrophomonadaceae bacterium]|nr:hypothetical protein [Bacillota bacterium]
MTGTLAIEASRLKVDMSEKIAELEPDKSQLITLTKKMNRKRVVTNPEFDWLEQDIGAKWDTVNFPAGYTDVATSIVVSNGAFFRAGDLVKVPRTAETLLVTAVAANTLTVIRSWGAIPAAAIAHTEPIVIISNLNAEGAPSRAILQREPVRRTNFTQIVRTPVGVTRTLQSTKTYGPKPLSWYRHMGGIDHAVDMERTMLFGERNRDQIGGQHRRSTGGILEFCTENILNVAATTLTEQSFVEWLETVFRFGSKEKILLACARLCTHIDLWSMGKLQTKPKDKTYGVSIKEYMTTHGTLYVTKHHLLEGAIYGGFGIILDLDNIAYCPLEGGDTTLLTNRQANDEDGQRDEYLTEFGVEVRLPRTHAIIRGVA